jgi:1,5-anhydro-D-fructose reductase (1,5-anhydro-D-mannitol-forming)
MIRIGLLSFWHLHGKDYAAAAQNNPSTEIVAVWDDDEARGAAQAESLGADYHSDLGELLARDDIDAVVVTSETSRHREVITAAARAGKHIFTEKVIASTLREAEEIIAEVQDANVSFMVSMWRSDEAYTRAIKELLDDGRLGRVTQVRVRDGHPFALPFAGNPDGVLPAHFWDPETAQGGILIDLCHPVYLVCAFLGLPDSVTANLGYVTGRAVEDNAVVTLGYRDGAVAIAETTSVSAFTPFSIEVHGTEGSLQFTENGIGELSARWRSGVSADDTSSPFGPDGVLKVRSNLLEPRSAHWEAIDLPDGPLPKAFDKWVTNIESGAFAHENTELARQLSAVIEAAYRSADTGTVTSIETLERAGARVS